MKAYKNTKDMMINLGIISEENLRIFSNRTRDNDNLKVWIDEKTNVIFLDSFYVGDDEYKSGDYKVKKQKYTGDPSFERNMDQERRFKKFNGIVKNKIIVDVGCKDGEFLKSTRANTINSFGVDLDKSSFEILKESKITCVDNLDKINENYVDFAFFFHSFEHFNDPLIMLEKTYRILKPGGKIFIEVPHARDILLNWLYTDEFKNFTLWSQHLILHTKESLNKIVSVVGFEKF